MDVACGNGNFSRRLAELGADVVAFDFLSQMIERARARTFNHSDEIEYKVLDATDYSALISLGPRSFDKAVCNMGLMDMAEITPLSMLLETCFAESFVVDGMVEPVFNMDDYPSNRFDWFEIPAALLVRLKKIEG